MERLGGSTALDTTLKIVFKIGLWWAEAVGEWMIRFARLHRQIRRYRGTWRPLAVASHPLTFMLWLVTRLAFYVFYVPTVWTGRILVARSA